jgi:hypothetical protein
MLSKLRRGESFAFSWTVDPEQGSGRGTVWLSPGVEIEFRFYGNKEPRMKRAWIQALNSTVERGELMIVPEPRDPHETSQTTTTRL